MKLRDLIRRTIWAAGGLAAAKLVMGISVPLPDPAVVNAYLGRGQNGLLTLYNFLGRGALVRGSAFALGFMPYLSARMFVSLARRVRPLEGEKKKWWTRGVTFGLSIVQSYGYAQFTQALPGAVSQPGLAYTAQTMLMLTSASMLLAFFVEEATEIGEETETLMLPREKAEFIPPGRSRDTVRDPLYISHPTPLP